MNMDDYKFMIGMRVSKTHRVGVEPKPFKSGLKVNTIRGVINHPQLNIPAFVFVEDTSYVECRRCVVAGGE